MALHDKDSVRDNLQDDIYASTDLGATVPKYAFPKQQHDPRHAYAVVRDELMLYGNAVGCSATGSSEAAMLGSLAEGARPAGGVDFLGM